MADDEILNRLDLHIEQANEHMARGNEHMARGNEHMARGNEHMARGNELMGRIEEEFRLNRESMRELTVRNERVWREVISEIRGLTDFVRGIREVGSEMVRELADLREESRAQREALLRMIDRLPPPQQA